MEKTYRVSLELDLSAVEHVETLLDENVITFHLEVEAENVFNAVKSALSNFACDTSVVSIVPVREG